jgi:hypothetical protein
MESGLNLYSVNYSTDLLRAAVNVEHRLDQFFAAAAHATTLAVV